MIVVLGMVLFIFFQLVLLRLVLDTLAWVRPGLPMLSNLAGLLQHSKAAILDAWRNKVAADLCGHDGFRGGPLLDVHASLQLLNSSHVRERDKALLRAIIVGGVWNGFLLGRIRHQVLPCTFCGAPDGDGHLFGECTFPPLVEIRESPEFHDLMREDKAHWPTCLLWHGWLPMLSGTNRSSPWAANASEAACHMVEAASGRYSSDLLGKWGPSDGYDEVEVASTLPDHPNIWTDGSLVLDRVTGISASGAGFFAHFSEECWNGSRWSHVDRVHPEEQVHSCRGFCSVPSGYRCFCFWCWFLCSFSRGLLSRWGHVDRVRLEGNVHSCRGFCSVPGLSNLSKELRCGASFWLCSLHLLFIWGLTTWVLFVMLGGLTLYELVNDGVLFLMLHLRGLDTVRISKVRGHSDEGMVLDGRVGELYRLVNDAADEAADFGRRSVGNAVIDARRNLSGVCGRWYPVVLDLHRFFIAISRAVVNHDGLGGTAPDPLVWSAGAFRKRRRLVHAVRDRAFLPGPPGIWSSDWFQVPGTVVCAEDVALWPYTPGLLVKWVSFLSTLHWPVGDLDLGVGGVSYVKLLILYELWAGERPLFGEGSPSLSTNNNHNNQRRRLVHAVRDRAFLPGPPGIWNSEWVNVPATAICAEDIAHWPYTPGLLVKWVSFLDSLHWPAGGLDLGIGGISYVELLILYELWAGERLSLEKGSSSLSSTRVFNFSVGCSFWSRH